ncbi:hypothetical protein QWY77_03815 [Thalassotalea ponticola]|uniref:hypothetical protein n=1 Tax=Thalassotalea ponticola TaxID=1523392 RepID=UPI0025B5B187|nr:hypothetical protein [Thalassotalea ponticola]MDN3651892.1 hypothetical protein [Thalassotalea ponticola]
MIRHFITALLLVSSLLLTGALQVKPATADEIALDDKLAIFAAYLGTWEATFETKGEQPAMVDVALWQRALNGSAIRTTHSINDGLYGGESFIFWDKEQQQLVFYYFTTAGFYTNGHIEIINDNQFEAYENVTGNDDGITQVRSTNTLDGDRIQVSTSYFKQGKWTESDSRTYYRSNKPVIFK